MSQWFQSQAADLYDTGYRSWSHGMTDVSITKVNMLKNSSTLAVYVPINISIKLGFVSVNGPRETYFVDALHTVRWRVPNNFASWTRDHLKMDASYII